MMKKQMTNEMELKVKEVIETRDAVYSFLEEIEAVVAEGKDAVSQLEQELVAKQEALSACTDIGEARLAKNEIKALEEDLELQIAVNDGKAKAMRSELEDIVESFFKVHKSAVFMYGAVDDFYLINTSLASLKEDKETLSGFTGSLNGSFSAVRNILLDTEIVANADQNKTYRGTHLGQRHQNTKLNDFDYHIRPYANQLRSAGIIK
ncbi:hypothetical protein Q75_09715 [Bacillus coahuilensis p1.1.43]|uniref:Uncharacterized protein n=1 Tax=Bacillus coahuilensis p1.1.43 TaxID=1150625 RepID=A0A147K800_9BACI|nr:hypothetical protein [Bacillus coahuilensis]KUP06197.1 hypothetical protein Q75_09715 [Bacillus coahuilensis p1.1.43]